MTVPFLGNTIDLSPPVWAISTSQPTIGLHWHGRWVGFLLQWWYSCLYCTSWDWSRAGCVMCCRQAIVLEGKYWKRRLLCVTTEYIKWRQYYKEKSLQSSGHPDEVSFLQFPVLKGGLDLSDQSNGTTVTPMRSSYHFQIQENWAMLLRWFDTKQFYLHTLTSIQIFIENFTEMSGITSSKFYNVVLQITSYFIWAHH